MSHIHITADGRKTSLEILDPEDAGIHSHNVGDEPTSKDKFGEGHTHVFEGINTEGPVDIEDEDNTNEEPKGFTVSHHGKITQCKQIDQNGLQVGVVAGYIATWDVDRGDWWGQKDKFVRGAFAESITDLAARNRHVRLKDHHGRTIGIFPIQGVFEDDRGLFGSGEINLEVQQGKEAYMLAKQKALTDFSIGFTPVDFRVEREGDDEIRVITKAIIWEGSIVDEPMNPAAQITQVKKFNAEDIGNMTERELEKALKANNFSSDAAKMIVKKKKENDDHAELITFIKKVSSDHKDQKATKELLNLIKQTNEDISATA